MKPLGTQIIAEFINCSKTILNDKSLLEKTLGLCIKKSGLGVKSLNSHRFSPVGVTVTAIIGQSHVAIHTYPEARHASVDIFTCSFKPEAPTKLLQFLKSKLKPKTVRVIELSRGSPLAIKDQDWITEFSPEGFEVRFHIKKNIFSRKSEYQQIDIIENENFGRMLFLDKDLQLAERDAYIYNQTIVSPIIEPKNGLGKVAILGGGDGEVLQELLKYKPKKVFVVDIDEELVRASKKFLQPVRKNAFDKPNVKVFIGDANEFLKANRGFDAIIYDWTTYTEHLTRMDRTAFLDRIFSKIKNSLKQNGIVSMQCCSELDTETLKLLNKILPKYFANISFKKVFVPSYCENWVFASAEAK